MIDVRRPWPRHARNHLDRGRAAVALVGLLAAALVPLTLVVSPAEARVPRAPHRYTAKIEPLASYVAQKTCSPRPKKGTVAFARMLLRTYPNSRSLGISRSCRVGGVSEHKEGRAFDWGVSVHSARDRGSVRALFAWLLKTDRHGNRFAMARRLGIQYMIWNRRIWGSYAASAGWRRYKGPNPHTDHVHFSLSWAGARKRTSFWNPKNFPHQSGGAPQQPQPQPPAPTDPGSGSGESPSVPKPGSGGKPEPQSPSALDGGPALVSERVSVPASRRAGARPTGALVQGHRYLVEAWGTYRYGKRGSSVADAECSRGATDWTRDRSVRTDSPGADHLDLYIDGHDLYAEADNGQSCDPGSHTYRWVYQAARSGRAPLAVWDPNRYDDNSGSVQVRLTDLDAPRTEASWTVPAGSPAGATSPGVFAAGEDYQVTVAGTWSDGSGVTSDAECTRSSGDPTWRRSREVGGYDRYDAHLARFNGDLVPDVEGVRMEPVSDSGDRCDGEQHRYTFVWQPSRTEPLNLRVDDPGSYKDNSGSLRVQVRPLGAAHAPAPAPPPSPTPAPSLETEELHVDSRSSREVWTVQEYAAGTSLRLTVSGAYLMRQASDWIAADAECTATSTDRTWRAQRFSGWFNGADQPLGDLAVNGRLLTWVPSDGQGDCDEQGHTYTADYTLSRSGRLSFEVADDERGDNNGELTVTVAAR